LLQGFVNVCAAVVQGDATMDRNDADQKDSATYKVVVNQEEQYSISPAYKANPPGWRDAGKTGPKPECLAYIKEVWTDMRPLSLRKKMEELAQNPPPPLPAQDANAPRRKSLVERLCEGNHSVEVSLRPDKTVKLFKEAIDRDYVHVKFTETNGGTEIGFRLDRANSDFSKANFEAGTGMAHVEGSLTLDYVKVKCVASIDLDTLSGVGRLIKIRLDQPGQTEQEHAL
jgi:uncharacterized protein YbdZ (MbtH family)